MFALIDLLWAGVAALACLSAGWWLAGANRRVRLDAIRDARRQRDRIARAYASAVWPSLN